VLVYRHAFLTLVLNGGGWSASQPSHFTPRERACGTHWIGGWVGPRTDLKGLTKRKKSHYCHCQELNPTHSTCSIVCIMQIDLTGKNKEFHVAEASTQKNRKVSCLFNLSACHDIKKVTTVKLSFWYIFKLRISLSSG